MNIFNECNIENLIEDKNNSINNEISKLNSEYFKYYTIQQIQDDIYNRYKLKNVPMFSLKELQYKVDIQTNFCKVFYSIELIGDTNYCKYQPSNRMFFGQNKYKQVCLDKENRLTFDKIFSISDLENKDENLLDEFIRQNARDEYDQIIKLLESLQNDVDKFNKNLPDYISKTLNKQKQQLDKVNNITSKISPSHLIQNNNAPNTEPIKLTKTITNIDKTEKNTIKTSGEHIYLITEDDYENIKRIINLTSTMMENAAFTFGKFEEESLRDVLLVSLNTHYENMVTGETFRKRGKTDIRVLFDDNVAYVGECKIWNGKGQINKAINQLESYCTWRDTRTSLIYFSKNKKFKDVLESINEYLNSKENKKIVECKKIKDNIWQCKIQKSKNDFIDMHLCVYDLYSKEDIKGSR